MPYITSRLCLVILAIAGLAVTTPFTPAQAQEMSDEKLNDKIRAFIMDNPKVLMKSIRQFRREQKQAQQRKQNEKAGKLAEQRDNDHIYGNKGAPISLIEYSDLECPYCKRFHATAKKLVDQSDGQINWIFRHLPLSMHKGAKPKAIAAECAAAQGGEDVFWTFTDAFFEDGLSLGKTNSFAEEQGLDVEQFKQCRKNEKFADRVEKQKSGAQSVGISGTPGIVLVNKEAGEHQVVSGAVPLSQLKSTVESLRE